MKATDRITFTAVAESNFGDTRGTRRDPLAQYLMDELGEDSLILERVLGTLSIVKSAGAEITQKVIDTVIGKEKLQHIVSSEVQHARQRNLQAPRQPELKRTSRGQVVPAEPVVYYMRIGNRIKIGTTTNIEMRMRDINPEELMCVEVGGLGLERRRHAQFRRLRTHGEWFELADELVSHINQLRSAAKK